MLPPWKEALGGVGQGWCLRSITIGGEHPLNEDGTEKKVETMMTREKRRGKREERRE